jgi:NAD(P)-dependent dehydrogenase (short-subunit alcohol dehydrogenase family)
MSFESKSVIVSGAGSGMGEATALEYGRRGAKVLVADLNADAAERVTKAIREEGGIAEAHQFDLRESAEVTAMVEAAVEHFGRLDVLACVAGIYQNSVVEEMPKEFWDNMFRTNLEGPLAAIKAAIPHMKSRGGAIVNVGTGAAFYPVPGLSAYGASKAGLTALTRSVALEQSPGIRVNLVVPGPTMTGGVKARPKETAKVAAARAEHDLPIGRWLDPQEIANVIVWASSDKASAVNGAILRVDAGHYML